MRNLEQTRRVVGTALQRIRAFVVNHFTFNAENRVKVAVFFYDLRSLSFDRRQLIVEERNAYEAFLRDLIAAGQTEQIIRPEIDAKLAAISILGMLNSSYQWYRPDDSHSAYDIAQIYGDFVVAGLTRAPDMHIAQHGATPFPFPFPTAPQSASISATSR